MPNLTESNITELDNAIRLAPNDESLSIYDAKAIGNENNFAVIITATTPHSALNAANKLYRDANPDSLSNIPLTISCALSSADLNAIKTGIAGADGDSIANNYTRITGIDCTYLGDDEWNCSDCGENWIIKQDMLTTRIIQSVYGNPEKITEAIQLFTEGEFTLRP